MAFYQLYFMNPESGRLDRAGDIEAQDDVEAVRIASHDDHRPLELWDRERKVYRFECPTGSEPRRYYDRHFLKPSKSLLTWGQGSPAADCELSFGDHKII